MSVLPAVETHTLSHASQRSTVTASLPHLANSFEPTLKIHLVVSQLLWCKICDPRTVCWPLWVPTKGPKRPLREGTFALVGGVNAKTAENKHAVT